MRQQMIITIITSIDLDIWSFGQETKESIVKSRLETAIPDIIYDATKGLDIPESEFVDIEYGEPV